MAGGIFREPGPRDHRSANTVVMIARLLLFLLCGAVPAALVARLAYRHVIAPRLQERAYRRLGALHAMFTCAAPTCSEHVDPSAKDSIFEHDRWWHRRCLKQTITQEI